MPNKVLYLDTPLDPPGGGQMSLFLILKTLDKTQFQPLVYLSQSGGFSEHLTGAGISNRIVPLRSLFSAIKKASPEIIHCNSSTTKYAFWSAFSAKLLRIPFVWHVRVIDSAGWKDRVISGLCAKIIVISDAVKQKFARTADKNKIEKIHNAVNIDTFRPGLDTEYLRNEFQVEKEKKIVGIFSRIDPWKGHTIFLESAHVIKEKIPQTLFLVVGEGHPDYKRRLTALVDELGLQNDIRFTGFRTDIPELMNLCDVVVNPSTDPEPFGRTVIEAMACGRPVVATKIGGVLEIIEENRTGILVHEKNAHQLAQACIDLLKHREKAINMGQMARQRAEKYFSAIQNVKRVEEIYADHIRRNKQHTR